MTAFTDYLERFAEINIIILALVVLVIGVFLLFGVSVTERKEHPSESYIRAWVQSYQIHLIGLVLIIAAALAYHARDQPLVKALVFYFR